MASTITTKPLAITHALEELDLTFAQRVYSLAVKINKP